MTILSKYKKQQTKNRAHKRSMRKVALSFLFVTTCLLAVLQIATWLNAQEMFLFRKIIVQGNRYVPEQEILDRVTIDSTKNLFDLDLGKLAQNINAHPHIEQVVIKRGFPSKLVIGVTVKEPIALLNDGELTPLDSSGKAIPGLSTDFLLNYPIITTTDKRLDLNNLNKIVKFLKTTKEQNFLLYHRISEISYSPKFGIYFYPNTRTVPVIVGQQSTAEKNNLFLKVFKQMEERLSNVEYFDLRFDNRVFVKQNNLS